jgi:hypothetical protein
MKLSQRQRTALASALANAFSNDELARLSGVTLPSDSDRAAMLESVITGLEERQALHTFIGAAETHGPDHPQLQDVLQEAMRMAVPSPPHEGLAEGLLALIRNHGVAEWIVCRGYVMFRPALLKDFGRFADPIVHGMKWFADAVISDVATHPLLLMGKYLSTHKNIPLLVRRRFNTWLASAAAALGYDSDDPTLADIVKARAAELEDARLHLLFGVGEWGSDKYGVRVWWQLVGDKDEEKDVLLDHSPPDDLVPYDRATFAALVTQRMIDVTEIRSAFGGEMTIEFFLPDELLLDLRVDDLPYEPPVGSPSLLGTEFPVMVRSYDRAFGRNDIRSQVLAAEWRRHWEWYRTRPHVCVCPIEIKTDQYAAAVKEEESSQVILGFTPSRCFCATMIETGTPIAVWPQRETQRFGELKETLKGGGSDDWRKRIHGLRRKAANIKAPAQPDDHCGRHLCLLWDDPDRVPPRSVYQQPGGPLT